MSQKRKRKHRFTKKAGAAPFTNMAPDAGRGRGGASGSRQVRPRPARPAPRLIPDWSGSRAAARRPCRGATPGARHFRRVRAVGWGGRARRRTARGGRVRDALPGGGGHRVGGGGEDGAGPWASPLSRHRGLRRRGPSSLRSFSPGVRPAAAPERGAGEPLPGPGTSPRGSGLGGGPRAAALRAGLRALFPASSANLGRGGWVLMNCSGCPR